MTGLELCTLLHVLIVDKSAKCRLNPRKEGLFIAEHVGKSIVPLEEAAIEDIKKL
jgi:hypothetical protein